MSSVTEAGTVTAINHYAAGLTGLDIDPGALWDSLCRHNDGARRIVADANGRRARALIGEQKWDSAYFDVTCWGVHAVLWDEGEDRTERLTRLLDEIDTVTTEAGARFMVCRLSDGCSDLVDLLQDRGWQLVDTLLVHVVKNWSTSAPVSKSYRIEDYGPEAATGMERIAGEADIGGHIDRDPAINEIKRRGFYPAVVKSLMQKIDGVNMFSRVAWQGERVVGFTMGGLDAAVSDATGSRFGYLWLIAVDPEDAGKGLGRALLDDFFNVATERLDLIEVSTQITNERALNLYRRAGLSVSGKAHTLHWHA